MLLEWRRHPTELTEGLSSLLDGRALLDVTLAAGGRRLKAHAVVLAAASDYFRVSHRI